MFFLTGPGLLIMLPLMGFALYAQSKVKRTFQRYLGVPNNRRLTGYQVARDILDRNGLSDVPVKATAGVLSDHYNPQNRTVFLSEKVYGGASLASVAVAAHEVGHAMQHAESYGPLKFRHALVPLANIGSRSVMFLVFAGFIFQITALIDLGILFYTFAILFQIVTLPVEFNASSRAIAQLDGQGYLTAEELPGSRSVLNAAALTYVAAAAVSIGQLIRLILLRNARD